MRALAVIALLAGVAHADAPGAHTPRELVESFLSLTDHADYAGAAKLVEPSKRSDAEVQRLVKRLGNVLDQYGPPDLDQLSSSPEGENDDNLPAQREHLNAPGGDADGPGSLAMVRIDGADGPRWLISRTTIARVDVWYRTLPSRWLVERLPGFFSRPGWLGVQPWQWIALLGAILISALGAFVFTRLTAMLLAVFAKRTTSQWDDLAVVHLRGPFSWAWLLGFLRVLLPLTGISDKLFQWIKTGMRGAIVAVAFWAAVELVDAARVALSRESNDRPGRRALLGIGGRLLKMVLVLVAVVVVISQLGFSVTSIVAGIGVGGLGLALAAQKTVENVFGAFSLGVDQPFREGDTVTVDTITGVVERIGLRSTRIRTADRTLIAIPNGKLADMRTETLTARDRFRLLATLSLLNGTPPDVLRKVLSASEAVLKTQPKVFNDAQARLVAVNAASVDVEVSATFKTSDANEFANIRQDVLLGLLDAVEQAGASLASPTVRILGGQSADAATTPQ